MATPNIDVPDDLTPVPQDLTPVSVDTHLAAAQIHNEVPDDLTPANKEAERGVIGETTDALKDVVGLGSKAWNATKSGINSFTKNLETTASDAGLMGALETGQAIAKAPFKAIGKATDIADRVAGTAVGAATDLLAYPLDSLINEKHTSLIDDARKRGLLSGDIKDPNEISFDNMFPVSLISDVGGAAGSQTFNLIGNQLDKSDSKTLKEAGELLHYTAPAAGLAAGIALFDKLPGDFAKFGQLTSEGIEAEKSGKLAKSLAERLEGGQQTLASFKAGPVDLGSTNFGKVGPAAAEKAAGLSVLLDSTKLGQGISKFTTNTNYPSFNEARDAYTIGKNQVEAGVKQFTNALDAKGRALGLDLEDPKVAETLTKGLDTPSIYNGDIEKKKLEDFFGYSNDELSKAVENARQNGINIPEKQFKTKGQVALDLKVDLENLDRNLERALPAEVPALQKQKIATQKELEDLTSRGDFSERYVPRYATPDKVKELRAAKAVQESVKGKELDEYNGLAGNLEEAQKLAKDMGGKPTAGGGGKFLKFRELESTASMNAKIEKELGVPNFFTNDISSAYADKIKDINQTVLDKKLVQSVKDQFFTSDGELLQKKLIAQGNIQKAIEEGRVVSPTDQLISGLKKEDLVRFGQLPEPLRLKLKSLEKASPELAGIEGLMLPREVADHLIENLAPQRLQGLIGGAVGTQNVFKAFLTSNPGFYVRNWFQNYVMGSAAGVSPVDNVKSFGALVKNSGEWAPRVEEYEAMQRGPGAYGNIENEFSSTKRLQKIARVAADKEDFVGDSAMKRLWYNMRQMGSTGAWKDFLADLKARGPDAVRENPIFKAAANIGNGGDEIPRFAYYNKLRDAGYPEEIAMQKVNKQFLNFNNTRTATKQLSAVYPFANHAIKNAEVTMRMLADSPGTALKYGPGGSFQRAIESWAGWDPNRTEQYKDMMGSGWASDQILLPVMPGFKEMNDHKDLLRDIVGKVYGASPEGTQLMLSLPSNFHALSMMDPTKLDEMTGPLIKAAVALYGTDPFTGNPLPSWKSTYGKDQRIQTAIKQFTDPMSPRTSINAIKGIMKPMQDDWAEHTSKLGMSEAAEKTLLTTPETQRAQKEIQKALVKASTLWRGNFTQLDNDLMFRIMAVSNASEDSMRSFTHDLESGKKGQSDVEKFRQGYIKDAAKIQKMVDIKEDYENMLKKTNAPAWQVLPADSPDLGPKPQGILDKISNIVEPEAGAATYSTKKSGDYTPGTSKSFGRASVLTKENMQPEDVKEPETSDSPIDPREPDKYLTRYEQSEIEAGREDPAVLASEAGDRLKPLEKIKRTERQQKEYDFLKRKIFILNSMTDEKLDEA